MVKMTGCNDTFLEVKVLASPKGVTTTFLLERFFEKLRDFEENVAKIASACHVLGALEVK